MPFYATIEDLPESVRRELPKDAQELYRETYNRVIARSPGDDSSAHCAAWAEVERHYERFEDTWLPRNRS